MNGQLWLESNYKNNKKHGLQRCWYHKGQLWYEQNYKDGISMAWKKAGLMTLKTVFGSFIAKVHLGRVKKRIGT